MAAAVFHVKHEGPPVALATAFGVDQALLERYEGLLRERAVPQRMVSLDDAPRLRERHLIDSLRATTAVKPTDRNAYDLGSGAGLPGIVVAIARPDLHVTLVERRRSRAAFLELVVDDLGLVNARVSFGGTEQLVERVDLAFARAFAPIDRSWRTAEPLLGPHGRLVYFAGSMFDPANELPDDVNAVIVPSSLAPSGPLVIMSRQ